MATTLNHLLARNLALLVYLCVAATFAVTATRASETSAQNSAVPQANAAWVYDVSRTLNGKRRYDPAYFAAAINGYNQMAGEDHKISLVYTYAGSLEMYCQKRDPSRCRSDDLVPIYPLTVDKRLEGSDNSDTVAAYADKLDAKMAGRDVQVVPLIDGVVNADYAGSLKGFNELSPAMAREFADRVARKVCSSASVSGVQFDLEPLNLQEKNGQYYFYRRIAENFSGSVPAASDEKAVACQSKRYPKGRFFSLFGSSNQLNPKSPAAKNLREILTEFNNGYFIAPLYDLGSGPPGEGLSVTEYQKRAVRHAKQMAEWASNLGVMYQLGVPAAATVHEHAYCRGAGCVSAPGSAGNSPTQEAYLESALSAIEQSGARDSHLFRGVAVWAWTRGVSVGGLTFEPQAPPWNALDIMGSGL